MQQNKVRMKWQDGLQTAFPPPQDFPLNFKKESFQSRKLTYQHVLGILFVQDDLKPKLALQFTLSIFRFYCLSILNCGLFIFIIIYFIKFIPHLIVVGGGVFLLLLFKRDCFVEERKPFSDYLRKYYSLTN